MLCQHSHETPTEQLRGVRRPPKGCKSCEVSSSSAKSTRAWQWREGLAILRAAALPRAEVPGRSWLRPTGGSSRAVYTQHGLGERKSWQHIQSARRRLANGKGLTCVGSLSSGECNRTTRYLRHSIEGSETPFCEAGQPVSSNAAVPTNTWDRRWAFGNEDSDRPRTPPPQPRSSCRSRAHRVMVGSAVGPRQTPLSSAGQRMRHCREGPAGSSPRSREQGEKRVVSRIQGCHVESQVFPPLAHARWPPLRP